MWTVKLPLYEANRLDMPNWTTIEQFETQEEAIDFVRYEFGAFADGTIQLVYEG
ncbi:MAG: hypothetical protein ACRYGG_07675 [Janthinobacterium lividum]